MNRHLSSGDLVCIRDDDVLRTSFGRALAIGSAAAAFGYVGKFAVVLCDATRPSGVGYVYVLIDGQFLELWTGRGLNRLVKVR